MFLFYMTFGVYGKHTLFISQPVSSKEKVDRMKRSAAIGFYPYGIHLLPKHRIQGNQNSDDDQ